MPKKPISIISTEGKTPEQIVAEATKAFDKFNKVSGEVRNKDKKKKMK